MIYYVLKILCGEHSKSEQVECTPPLPQIGLKLVQKYSKAVKNKKEAISNGEHKSKSSVRLISIYLKDIQKIQN